MRYFIRDTLDSRTLEKFKKDWLIIFITIKVFFNTLNVTVLYFIYLF